MRFKVSLFLLLFSLSLSLLFSQQDTLIYITNFTSVPPPGWQVINGGNSNNYWGQGGSPSYYYAHIRQTEYLNPADEYLRTISINPRNLRDITLIYRHYWEQPYTGAITIRGEVSILANNRYVTVRSINGYYIHYLNEIDTINISEVLQSNGINEPFRIEWWYGGGNADRFMKWELHEVIVTAHRVGINEKETSIFQVSKIFSDFSSIKIFLPFDAEIEIFNITGNKIQTIKAKSGTTQWQGKPGVYFVRVGEKTQKVIISR